MTDESAAESQESFGEWVILGDQPPAAGHPVRAGTGGRSAVLMAELSYDGFCMADTCMADRPLDAVDQGGPF